MKSKLLFAVFLITFMGTNAFAATTPKGPPLKGEYGISGMDTCLVSLGGFNANLQPNTGSTVFSQTSAVEGISTFDGKGNVTNSSTSATITPPPTTTFPPSASSSDTTHQSTYVTNADDSFVSTTVAGTFKGTVLTGPRAGQTFTISNFPVFTGLISSNSANLTSATLTPTVETITFSNGDVEPRICQRSRVYILLKTGSAL
jgi:hypothetical protein